LSPRDLSRIVIEGLPLRRQPPAPDGSPTPPPPAPARIAFRRHAVDAADGGFLGPLRAKNAPVQTLDEGASESAVETTAAPSVLEVDQGRSISPIIGSLLACRGDRQSIMS
jgi:hypothetical protein